MSESNPSSQREQNAYQAPQYVSSATKTSQVDPSRLHELSAKALVFRGYCLTLGVLLCAWGAIYLVISVVSATAVVNSADPNEEAFVLLASLAFNTIAMLGLGAAICFRYVGAAWGFLAYVAVMVVLSVIDLNFSVCLFVIFGALAALAVAIIVQAAKLRAEGVSPRAKLKNGLIV